MSFEHRTVMVTGAAGNLGQAVAAAFAGQGARLVLLGRQIDSLRAVFGDEGADRLFLATDLLDGQQVAAAVAAAVARFGRIDVLCNLAGGFRMGDAVHETADSTWDFLLDINARLVHALQRHGAHAFGVSGEEGRLLTTRKATGPNGEDLGFVGEVERVDTSVLDFSLIDHLILGEDQQYYSFRAAGRLGANSIAR